MKTIKLVMLVSVLLVFSFGCSQGGKVSSKNGLSDPEKDLFFSEIQKRATSMGYGIASKGEIVLFDKVEYPDFTGKKSMTSYGGFIPLTMQKSGIGPDAPFAKMEVYFEVVFGRAIKKDGSDSLEVGTIWMGQFLSRGICAAGDSAKREEFRSNIMNNMKEVRDYKAQRDG